jgi:Protein of unknown function (DUF2894)
MSERAAGEASGVLPAGAEASVLASLHTLREAGAAQHEPVLFQYIEALASRMQAAPEAVRRVLHGKLRDALADCARRVAERSRGVPRGDDTAVADVPSGGQVPVPEAPLAVLNRYIRDVTGVAREDADAAPLAATGELWPELKNAQRFKEAWSRIDRGPEGAGPLNGHKLMLRSLTLMRELSPDYLRHFLSHAESLLWLDRAYGRLKRTAVATKPKAARRVRTPK